MKAGTAGRRRARRVLGALAVAALLAALVPAAFAAAQDTPNVTYTMTGESHSDQHAETNNGESTYAATHTTTTTVTGSDGSSSTMTTTDTQRTDGTHSTTQTYTSSDGEGNTHSRTTTDDYDSNGTNHHSETDVTTDSDGNRTTKTSEKTIDSNGNVTDEHESTVTDRVSPAPSRGESPASWTGIIGFTFIGTAAGTDPTGFKLTGTYVETAMFTVTMAKERSDYWAVSSGTAVGSQADDMIEDPGDAQWEIVAAGGGTTRMQSGSCELQRSADGTYSLTCADVDIPGITWMGYIAADLEEGPRDVTWRPPQFTIGGIAPGVDGSLNGSRKARVVVDSAGSIGLYVQADVDFALTPVYPDTPSSSPEAAPKADEDVSVDAPPEPMSIDQSGGRIVVGFEVQAGKKVSVKVGSNKVGAMTAELRKPDGSLAMVGGGQGETWELPAQTLDAAGTYTVTLEAHGGGKGSFSFAVVTPPSGG